MRPILTTTLLLTIRIRLDHLIPQITTSNVGGIMKLLDNCSRWDGNFFTYYESAAETFPDKLKKRQYSVLADDVQKLLRNFPDQMRVLDLNTYNSKHKFDDISLFHEPTITVSETLVNLEQKRRKVSLFAEKLGLHSNFEIVLSVSNTC